MYNGTHVLHVLREIKNFEISRVNLLSYIKKKIGTVISLREINNFDRECHLYSKEIEQDFQNKI